MTVRSVSLAGIAEFLEREAGYELISLGLIVGALIIMNPAMRIETAKELVSFGLGVLARSMGSRKTIPPAVQPDPEPKP